ncbi:MAG: hypothetical protein ACYDGN_00750 [Acidimicrobiales bacterium]
MADIRKDLTRTAQDLSRIAQDAAYVAVGLGVVGLQKAQVTRRELVGQIERQRKAADGSMADLRSQVAKAWMDLDGAIGQLIEAADATLEPVADRLPPPAQQVFKQAQEARDRVRTLVKEQIAAA